MADEKEHPKPLPPSVTKVFDDFLQRLEKEPAFDQDMTKRLRAALLEHQTFDADSLGEVLKIPKKTSP
jgi:hypothetical protein